MSDEYLKQVEYRLNGRIDDLGDTLKETNRALRDHVKDHRRVEGEISEHGRKIAEHSVLLPELKETMQKMGDSVDKLVDTVNNFAIQLAQNDAKTDANTQKNKTTGEWTKEIVIGILLITLGYVLKGG